VTSDDFASSSPIEVENILDELNSAFKDVSTPPKFTGALTEIFVSMPYVWLKECPLVLVLEFVTVVLAVVLTTWLTGATSEALKFRVIVE